MRINTAEQEQPLDPRNISLIPSMMIPSFRSGFALQQKIERNIIMKTWGGLGDQICAEPTLRYALKSFKDCSVSLASELPALFSHLPFKEIYDLKKVQPIWLNYFPFDTILPPDHLQWEFMSHMLINCVDFPSLCAFRCQLPIAEKEVILKPTAEQLARIDALPLEIFDNGIIVHAGKHWQSKTFPKDWWDEVLSVIIEAGFKPVLIGADTDDNRSTVDVNPNGCIDLRNLLSVMETVALLQRSTVLLTNDSAPLHMAASSSKCWIGFIATCKHPDHITHWRNGQWGYRMKNHGLGGIWEVIDYCPNKENNIEAESVPVEMLKSWLPKPSDFVRWAIDIKVKTRYEENRI